MEEYIPPQKKRKSPAKWIALVVIVGLLAGFGFYAKDHMKVGFGSNSGSSSCSGQSTLMIRVAGQAVQTCGKPVEGTVQSSNATSITVSISGGSQTFSITGSTKISDNGKTISAIDIKAGEKVIVVPSSVAGQANYVLINPNTTAM